MDNKKITIAFEFNYQDCYMAKMEAFSGDYFPEYVGTILMPKRHPLKHKGEPFKLWPGVYKVSFSFEDGYYSMNLIVNKKPLRIRLIGEIESACEPTYAAPALFMVMEADMTEKKWTDLCRRLQADGVNQACVFWNYDADFSENELPMKFFEEGEVDEDFEDEWV